MFLCKFVLNLGKISVNKKEVMQVFYLPDVNNRDEAWLPPEEAHHCVAVLRLKKGDRLHLVNGLGTLYEACIIEIYKDRCKVRILSSVASFRKRDYHLHIAVALPKNIDRFEWFLEKVTETGIDEITPLLCRHAERKTLNEERCRRVLIAAMKQSGKAFLPVLHAPCSFEDFVKIPREGGRYLAHCQASQDKNMFRFLQKDEQVTALIGPEGDFSPDEVSLAMDCGYLPVSLGSSLFRTETAALAVCMAVYVVNEMK